MLVVNALDLPTFTVQVRFLAALSLRLQLHLAIAQRATSDRGRSHEGLLGANPSRIYFSPPEIFMLK